jgi:hypothetical protein
LVGRLPLNLLKPTKPVNPESYGHLRPLLSVDSGAQDGVYGSGVFPFRISVPLLMPTLNESRIRAAKPAEKPYKLFDEGGLSLLVTPAGGRL